MIEGLEAAETAAEGMQRVGVFGRERGRKSQTCKAAKRDARRERRKKSGEGRKRGGGSNRRRESKPRKREEGREPRQQSTYRPSFSPDPEEFRRRRAPMSGSEGEGVTSR